MREPQRRLAFLRHADSSLWHHEPMTELKTYTGGCHCGKVRYDVKVDLSAPVGVCNCSRCSKLGVMLAFAPADQFTLKQGGDVLTDYQFNKKVIHHTFCSVCGIESFARGIGPDGKEMCAINVRCLDDVDIESLKTMKFDGKSA
ncbi:GFA family protein [Sorangium sp. So ce341]